MDNLDNFNNWISKTRGKATQPGPQPGPAPRSGLEWNSNSHRWVVSGGKAENYRRIYNDLVRLRHPYSAIPEFDTYDEVAPDIPMEKRVVGQKFGMCYMNAYRHYKTTGMKVVVGYAVEKESVDKAMNLDYDKDYWLPGINTTLHAWNVDNQGRVVDTSLGSKDARNHVYFGKTVPEESLGKATNDLEGEKEVIDYVGKVMDEESSRIRSETASEDELNRNYDEWKKRHDSRVVKARGVAIAPGPPPGAPPRPGLEWDSDSHRWIRPEDAKLHDEIASKSHISPKDFIDAIRHLSTKDQVKLGKHICWENGTRKGAYFSNMSREATVELAKYIDKEFLTDMNDPQFLEIEEAAEDMMRHGSDPEARKIAYKVLQKHPNPKTIQSIEDMYGHRLMTGNIDHDIDTAVSGYEATAAGAEAKWMMVAADKIFNGEDAEYNDLGLYTYRFPEPEYSEVIKKLYEQTQEYYKKKGITHIKLFRGLTKHRGETFTLRDSEALSSWTTDKKIATFHAKRGNIADKHYSAYIVTVDMPVENILYSYETVPQLKTKTFRKIVNEDSEFVVIKKKDQKLFKGQGAIVRIQPDDEENAELLKTKGVATNYGPPPGPSPRPGLVWKPDSHRWTKPEESSKEAIRIVEEPYNKQLRIKRGFTQIVTIDAKKFQDLYEKTHEEKLAWNQDRAKKLKDLKTYDSYPLATNSDRGVDVGDGRHRIAEAARRGALVEVATDPKFPLPDDLIEEVHEVETEEAKSDVFARDYWDDLLEHNELRMSGNKTSQGALTAYLLEAAGDVLRELGKPDAYDIDPAYINAKLRRIRMNLTDKSWEGEVGEPELTLLHQIRSDIQGIPVTSKRIGAVKQLITAIAHRDKMATKEILGGIDTELGINKAQGVATSPGSPPGLPPRPGLQWKADTHRWIRPSTPELIELDETPENTKSDWHEMKDTVTLYHGTTDLILDDIAKHGITRPDVVKMVEDTIRAAGIDPNNVPDWVKSEIKYRGFNPDQGPTIYLSSNYDQAKRYADKEGGELMTSTYDGLKKWAKEEGIEIKPLKEGNPVVIKIEVPVASVFTHGSIPYRTPVKERFLKLKEYLDRRPDVAPEELEFEIVSHSDISPEHVKGVITPSIQKATKIKKVEHIEVDIVNAIEVEKSEGESFDNTVTFEGKKYVNLGNTFRTDIDVEVGTILEVNVQELTVMNGRLSWDKPQVTGIEHGISIPYPASKALSIASKYNGVIKKAEKRSASQEDLQEFDEGGRDKFNVKSGDEGTLSIDEHITFLDEDGAKEFINTKTYEAWKTAKKRLEGHSGSLHNDIRIKIDDSDFLRGFTATVGSVNNRNKVLENQEGDKVLVASFKAHTPHGKTKWQTDVGVGEAWIFEPGEIGSPGKRWSAIFKVEKKARVKIGRIDDHFVEMRITNTKYMPSGRWILMLAPLSPGQRSWIFMRPKKQEFDELSLNEEIKPVVKVQKGSLLKAVMENIEGK